jgi:hypothetical protein
MATMTRLSGSGALLAFAMVMVLPACGTERSADGGASSPPSETADQQPSTATQLTLSGVIIEGLRPNCRVLQTDHGRYALTGARAQRLQQDDEVSVTGVQRSDLINPCGLTFLVASIRTLTAPSSPEPTPRNGPLPTP